MSLNTVCISPPPGTVAPQLRRESRWRRVVRSETAAAFGHNSAAVTRPQLIWLTLILTVALALRLTYFAAAIHTPGYVWQDPDGYVEQALRLSQNGQHWQWTFKAVTYGIQGREHALPPGYSVFLSIFAMFPGFPRTAQVAQIVLAVGSVALVFLLGRLIHSTRAGLAAAAGYALWVPSVFSVWSTSQETFYLPVMLLGFFLLTRAIVRDAGPIAFGIAGLVFGVAALTRSMPLFFIGPAALVHIGLAPAKRRAAIQAAVFVLGVLLFVAPYSAALTKYFGRLTIIDTHGSIHFDVSGPQGTDAPPSLADTARALAQSVAARPWGYFLDCVERARTLFYLNGGRMLQIYVASSTRAGAAFWKLIVHLGADVPLLFAAILAPIGAVLCRERRVAAVFVLWALVNIGIAALGGFGGARLRQPFEPLMLVLAAVVLVGAWQRPSRTWLAVAGAGALVAAVVVVPQIPRSLAARADYGVAWPSVLDRPKGRMIGTAGFNVLATTGAATFDAIGQDAPAGIDLLVRANGRDVATTHLESGQRSPIHVPWPEVGMAFVDVSARRSDDGRPATLDIAVQR